MPIEVLSLENFSAIDQGTSSSYLLICKQHAVFHPFILDNRK